MIECFKSKPTGYRGIVQTLKLYYLKLVSQGVCTYMLEITDLHHTIRETLDWNKFRFLVHPGPLSKS